MIALVPAHHIYGTIFTAHRNGKCVGRITAQIDREHLDRYKDETGFFGFFDTIVGCARPARMPRMLGIKIDMMVHASTKRLNVSTSVVR